MIDLGDGVRLLSQHVDGLEVTCHVSQAPPLMRETAHPRVDENGAAESLCLLERELVRRKKAQLSPDPPGWWEWPGPDGTEAVQVMPARPRTRQAFGLKTRDWLLMVAPVRSVVPRLTFQFRSAYLLRTGPLQAYLEVKEWAEKHVISKINGVPSEESADWKVSRLDLAADLAGLDARAVDLERFTTKAAHRAKFHAKDSVAVEHYRGSSFTGLTLGRRGSPIHARIYDKTREACADAEVREVWRLNGYEPKDHGDQVWRIEFELRRELFRELLKPGQVELSNDPEINLKEDLDDLWAHCVKDWLVLRTPEGSKRLTRRAVEGWWARLGEVSALNGSRGEPQQLARRPARPVKAENQLDRALTSLIGYAATTGVEGLDTAVSALREFADERGGQDAFEDRTRKRGKR